MRIRYTWRPEEWHEAVLLASEASRRSSKPLLTYAMIGIMGLGVVGEIANAIRSSTQIHFAGSLAPALMLGAALIVAVFTGKRSADRRRRMRGVPNMPTEEQVLVLCEEGWWSAADADTGAMRVWHELSERRNGKRTLVLIGRDSRFIAVPLRALSVAQGGHLYRLLTRKLRSEPDGCPAQLGAA